jgi:hypothetical protein
MAQPLAPSDQLWLDLVKSTIDSQTPAQRATIKQRAASFARELAEIEAAELPTRIERKAS